MPKDAIEYIVKSLVEQTEAVVVQEKSEEGAYRLVIKTDNGDVGKVIGKDGKTIRALRTIANLFGPEGQEKFVDIEQ